MKVWDNGTYRDATENDIEKLRLVGSDAEAAERTRPMTAEEVTALLIKQQINSITVDDQTALRMRRYYPTFVELVGQTVKLGTKFRADDSENTDL